MSDVRYECIKALEDLPLTLIAEYSANKWRAAALTRKLAIMAISEILPTVVISSDGTTPQRSDDSPPAPGVQAP